MFDVSYIFRTRRFIFWKTTVDGTVSFTCIRISSLVSRRVFIEYRISSIDIEYCSKDD